jgi:hypothetical protein
VVSNEDSFRFLITSCPTTESTKRSILSLVARLYDPLGWASPIVISAKILMQELWLQKLDWDSPIPPDMQERWNEYCSGLSELNNVRIPRWTRMHRDNVGIELHGFADASTRAYAAVVYFRVLHSLSNVPISIIAAKTKVAPLKTISVPRLELNAIVLLTRLIEWVITSLQLREIPLYGWTDSTVALAWLRQHPTRWSSYVANRVSEVQTRLPGIRWNHVRSRENPSDCASRGMSARDLVDHQLWWSGPSWLREPSVAWPIHDGDTQPREDVLKSARAEERKSYRSSHGFSTGYRMGIAVLVL